MLMELPWPMSSYKLRYLLERTEVPGRSYQPVTRRRSLPQRLHALVKLHGSFPAQTPFIITEEDYRLSEKVCLVRQLSAAVADRNAFVLIGFSGDDPNFLHGLVGFGSARRASRTYLSRWSLGPKCRTSALVRRA